MEHFIVSARKYRPTLFKDVVGQQVITNTLESAIENNHLAQALLFTGPRGVGKTTCARILAKKINQDGSQNENEDFAFNIFELDAASNNSVDDIRNLTEQVRIPPQIGNYKVYIIDEVHMLSTSAFNAFLKTLEEPPKHCIFILATTEKNKIIPTILSRCQIYDFKRISNSAIVDYLIKICDKENVKYEIEALEIIANKADGAMRDALSTLDRLLSFDNKEINTKNVSINLNILDYEVFHNSIELIINNNIPDLLLTVDNVITKGFEGINYITGLSTFIRNLLVSKNKKTAELLNLSKSRKEKLVIQSENISVEFLISCLEILNKCEINYKSSINQRLLVELTIMQLGSLSIKDQKKNLSFNIIPFNYFKDRITNDVKKYSNKKQPPSIVKPILNIKNEGNSGLSLNSITTIKNHENKSNNINKSEIENLPTDNFNQENLTVVWNSYSDKIESQGSYNLASILRIDSPKLINGNVIKLELPNSTNKVELEYNQHELLKFIRKELNNYSISLDIEVNEKLEKKFTYTTKEKYDLLKNKNESLEKLRKEFKLTI